MKKTGFLWATAILLIGIIGCQPKEQTQDQPRSSAQNKDGIDRTVLPIQPLKRTLLRKWTRET